ncbi:MAG: YHS domain-containing protein, partial [Galactobacter sp.]
MNTKAKQSVTDPVCGMTLDPAQAAASEKVNGQTYYFCSEGCHAKFVAHPEEYADHGDEQPAHPEHAHAGHPEHEHEHEHEHEAQHDHTGHKTHDGQGGHDDHAGPPPYPSPPAGS